MSFSVVLYRATPADLPSPGMSDTTYQSLASERIRSERARAPEEPLSKTAAAELVSRAFDKTFLTDEMSCESRLFPNALTGVSEIRIRLTRRCLDSQPGWVSVADDGSCFVLYESGTSETSRE